MFATIGKQRPIVKSFVLQTYIMTEIKKNISLKPYTRFQVGGIAESYVEASNWRELVEAVTYAKVNELPYYILAGGSNIAFDDGILPGMVIRFVESPDTDRLVRVNDTRIEAEANVLLWPFVKYLIERGLAGFERLSGIPGTLGGAVVGNAGAYGVEIKDYLTRVHILDGDEVRWVGKDECDFKYRHSIYKEQPWVVLEAEFNFTNSSPAELDLISKDTLERRKKFKWDMKIPGSYFKNLLVKDLSDDVLAKVDARRFIEGKLPVGYLLESVAAKGYKVGGLTVSDFHANIFLNDGTATYSDLVELISELKRRVKDKYNIDLVEEVRRVDADSFVRY